VSDPASLKRPPNLAVIRVAGLLERLIRRG